MRVRLKRSELGQPLREAKAHGKAGGAREVAKTLPGGWGEVRGTKHLSQPCGDMCPLHARRHASPGRFTHALSAQGCQALLTWCRDTDVSVIPKRAGFGSCGVD